MKRSDYIFIFILGSLIFAGQLALYVYLPALPLISKALSTSNAVMEMSVSFFLLGFGLSQLIYGPLSDTYGRKPVLVFGMVLLSAGLFLGSISFGGFTFLLSRVLQGVGGGAYC